ncbi:MAG: nucleotidyltransferase family protein [Deltaproteobacteria bacterium]|nr:nucleotidyltransferase family protein [Deltaproteobacteria bacterium]
MNFLENFLFLCRSLRPAPPELGSQVSWEEVAYTASHLLLTPALYPAWQANGFLARIPADLAAYLEALHQLNTARNQDLRQQLWDLTEILNQAGVIPLPLKGAARLLACRGPALGRDVLQDLDLLVPARQAPLALAALQEAGYQLVAPLDSSPQERYSLHYPPLAHPAAPAMLELHWEAARRPFQAMLPAREILARARPARTPAGGVHLAPAPRDQLAVLWAHLMWDFHYLGSFGLRRLWQAVELRRRPGSPLPWDELTQAARGHGLARPWSEFLGLAWDLLGQAPPPGQQVSPGPGRLAALLRRLRHPRLHLPLYASRYALFIARRYANQPAQLVRHLFRPANWRYQRKWLNQTESSARGVLPRAMSGWQKRDSTPASRACRGPGFCQPSQIASFLKLAIWRAILGPHRPLPAVIMFHSHF